jgi:hypothetical protein
MGQPRPCPERTELRRLLQETPGGAAERRLSRHLDKCPQCRELLESLAGGGGPGTVTYWPSLRGGEQLPEALRQVMDRLKAPPGSEARKAEAFSSEQMCLGFLDPPAQPAHLGRLGLYEVTEVLGRGGFGVVFKAHDPSLNRFVAIKVLAPYLASNVAARKRFAREGRAAAAVSHQHVVAIHAVHECNGLPYLVMEYVPGISLQERLDRSGPLDLKEVLRIGLQTAAGLAAAHAQGLVHRDIKPANILLEHGVERVKITDFGLARAADDASLTQSGVLAGTPQYMAPEQAQGRPLDHRADLFSLGSVLYALCTGRPPFRAPTPLAVLRRICEDAPRPVRDINPEVPAWLEEVIQVLHAKDPDQRFQSAAEVGELLGQHLAHLQQPAAVPRPVLRRRAGGRRWPHRRWALVAGAIVLAVGGLLTLGKALKLQSWHPAALWARLQGGTSGGRQSPGGREVAPRLRANLDPGDGPAFTGAFAPGGEVLAIACDDGNLRLWHPSRGQLSAVLAGHRERMWGVAFSPDGKRLATAAGDWYRPLGSGEAKLWDPVTRRPLATLQCGQADLIFAVTFSPDSKLLATAGWDGTARLWDATTGKPQRVLSGHQGPVRSAVFTRDSKSLVTGGFDGSVKVWEVATGKELATLRPEAQPGRRFSINCVAISPDGRLLASAENVLPAGPLAGPGGEPGGEKGLWGRVRLWDLAGRRSRAVLEGYNGRVLSVAFSPDGKLLATGGGEYGIFGEVKLWDLPRAAERVNLLGHDQWVECVAFSPDGRLLVTAGGTHEHGGEVRLWDVYGAAGAEAANNLPAPTAAPKPPTPAARAAALLAPAPVVIRVGQCVGPPQVLPEPRAAAGGLP